MCTTLSGRAAYCNCTIQVPNQTLVRMCDVALRNERTPCHVARVTSAEKSPTDPACLRCSRVGDIIVFVSPSATRRTSRDMRDKYDFEDVYAELRDQLAEASQNSLPSTTLPNHPGDRSSVEDLKDAESFVMVEHYDVEEQELAMIDHTDAKDEFEESATSPMSPELDEDDQKFLA